MITPEGYETLSSASRLERSLRRGRTLPRLLSVDVFDTLLWRGTRPEFVRFADVSVLQSRALVARGWGGASALALLRTRLAVTRQAYQRVRAEGGEVCFRQILENLCQDLALPADAVDLFEQVELDYEKTVLRPNRALALLLQRLAVPVVVTSDTPLAAARIAELMRCFHPDLPLQGVFASCQEQATKRDGSLYPRLCRHFDVDPGAVVHVGDNPLADGKMAAANGLAAKVIPRILPWRLVHGWRAGRARRRLRGQGLIP